MEAGHELGRKEGAEELSALRLNDGVKGTAGPEGVEGLYPPPGTASVPSILTLLTPTIAGEAKGLGREMR